MRTKEEISVLLGLRIRTLRVANNMTMEELAMESEIDYSHLSKIERGKINTSVYQVYILARALNVPLESVFKDLV